MTYSYNESGYLTRAESYNDDGSGGELLFVWDGDRLVSRSYFETPSNQFITSVIIYDADGEAQGFMVNNSEMFLYRKNLQGDITGIVTPAGKLLCEYTYDAYGNVEIHLPPTSITLAEQLLGIFITMVNPLLYRGYVYTSTGTEMCYYLGSRYYMPELGRFLNADAYADTGTGAVGTNMFTYCNNNPVMHIDPTGEAFNTIKNFFAKLKNVFSTFIAIFGNPIKTNTKVAVSANKLTNTKYVARVKQIECPTLGLKFRTIIYYQTGEYKKRKYAKLIAFEFFFMELGKWYSYTTINYAYGTTNTTASCPAQMASGTTSENPYIEYTPTDWLAVNIASYEKMKAFIGVTVVTKITVAHSEDYYELEFKCLTDEWSFDIWKNGAHSQSIYWGHGQYNDININF